MKSYDIVIVGGATSGSYFAHKMAAAGHSVLVLERHTADRVGSKYDIFHIGKPDFERFGLPRPEPGEDFVFEYTGSVSYSAFGRHGKAGDGTVVGMHMQRYTARMNRWARQAGADYLYGAVFVAPLFEEDALCGVEYERDGQRHRVGAGLVADCSGIPSVVRRSLPDGYGVENFEITPMDMFYVILRYVKYLDEKDYLKSLRGWTYYKTWEAPQQDPRGAILGVGANVSFQVAERIYAEFEQAIPLPRHQLQYKEQGTTPYRRPPYSFVADGFIAMGDAACLTKPSAGEGVTSSMVQIDIAAEVAHGLLERGAPLDRAGLWPVNKRYVQAQGKRFANQLATFVGAVATSPGENDFFYEKDIIFTAETLSGEEEVAYSAGQLLRMALVMLGGVLGGRLRPSTIRSLLRAMKNGGRVSKLYEEYPETPEDFEAWCARADAIWAGCGSMADHVLATLQEEGGA